MPLLVLGLLIGSSGVAQAQRGSRRGPAMTPYGQVYNPTQSPEWRQAGGNPIIYNQIIEQKLMAAQQKAMASQLKAAEAEYKALQKKQQAHERWLKEQKAKKEKNQPVDPAYQRLLDLEAQQKAAMEARISRAAAKRTKKRPTSKPAVPPVTEAKKDGDEGK